MPDIEKLKEIIKKLQEIMRLQDWDIEIRLMNNREMDSICKMDYIPGGYCSRNRYYKSANIYLNCEDKNIINGDWYNALVHEMFHIIIDSLDEFMDNTLFPIIEENKKDLMQDKYDFEKEKVDCMFARLFVNAYPVTNFIKEDK